MKNKKGDGPSVIFEFTMQNHTDNRITSFEILSYAKALFKDGSFSYYPHKPFGDDENNDIERFNNRSYTIKNNTHR